MEAGNNFCCFCAGVCCHSGPHQYCLTHGTASPEMLRLANPEALQFRNLPSKEDQIIGLLTEIVQGIKEANYTLDSINDNLDTIRMR